MNSINTTARVAGLLYLVLAVLGAFAILFVRETLIVPGDAAATVANVTASAGLLRLGFASEVLTNLLFILLVLFLYKLLKPVNKAQAVLMVVLVLVSVPITMLNLLNQIAAQHLLSGADYLAAFEPDQVHALAMFFFTLLNQGTLIAMIFWGLWLLPLGYLVFKSGFLPGILGILLIIAGVGYVVDFAIVFFFPSLSVTISLFTFIGEILFPLWLLIKGVNVAQWERRALEAA